VSVPTPHLLTPVQGGHVWPGTWEKLQRQHSAECAACGASLRSNGLRTLRPLGEGLCQGWKSPSERPVLPDLVRGMVREAPRDNPNGPSEEAIQALHAAHLKVIEWPERELGIATEGAVIERLTHSLADDARALRLALEHDERSAK